MQDKVILFMLTDSVVNAAPIVLHIVNEYVITLQKQSLLMPRTTTTLAWLSDLMVCLFTDKARGYIGVGN